MTELRFQTDKGITYYDRSLGMHLKLTAEWYVRTEAAEDRKTIIESYTAMMAAEALLRYEGNVSFSELADRYGEISDTVSEKLTDKLQVSCVVSLTGLKPDESSARIIDQMERMKKFSDPAFAAAEMERAMKQAKETAEKNGISVEDLKNAPLPDLPPIPDTSDPLERAKAIAARNEQLRQMATGGPHVAPSVPVPAPASAPTPAPTPAPAVQAVPFVKRPKFCTSCGNKLPESGNFCPNCGNKI